MCFHFHPLACPLTLEKRKESPVGLQGDSGFFARSVGPGDILTCSALSLGLWNGIGLKASALQDGSKITMFVKSGQQWPSVS